MSKRFWDTLSNGLISVGLAERVETTAEEVATPAPIAGVPPLNVQVPAGTFPPAVTVVAPVQATPELQARLAELDRAAKDRLIQVMAEDGAPLVEELSDTLETLADAIPDEGARFKAALKLMVKKGSPIGAVLGDLDKCLGVLDQNFRTFETDTKGQLDQRVGTKVKAVQDIDGLIKAKGDQITALQNEIAELTLKRNEQQAGITVEQQKIAQVQERFGMVYRAIRTQVETQRAKVAQYGAGL